MKCRKFTEISFRIAHEWGTRYGMQHANTQHADMTRSTRNHHAAYTTQARITHNEHAGSSSRTHHAKHAYTHAARSARNTTRRFTQQARNIHKLKSVRVTIPTSVNQATTTLIVINQPQPVIVRKKKEIIGNTMIGIEIEIGAETETEIGIETG